MIQPVLLIINTSREPIIPSKNSIASETRLRLRRITFLAFLLLLWCLLSVEQRLFKKTQFKQKKKEEFIYSGKQTECSSRVHPYHSTSSEPIIPSEFHRIGKRFHLWRLTFLALLLLLWLLLSVEQKLFKTDMNKSIRRNQSGKQPEEQNPLNVPVGISIHIYKSGRWHLQFARVEMASFQIEENCLSQRP